MRVFVTPMIVSLAATSAWFGWLAVPAEAAEGPDVCQMMQNWVAGCQGPCEDQEPCDESGALRRSLHPVRPLAGASPPRPSCWNAPPHEANRCSSNPQTLSTDPLNAKDLNFPVTLGYRVDGIRRDVCGCDWEVGYFQVDGFCHRRHGARHLDDDHRRHRPNFYGEERPGPLQIGHL